MVVMEGGDGKDDDCDDDGGDDDHITHITAYKKLNTSHAMLCYVHKDINISVIMHSCSND